MDRKWRAIIKVRGKKMNIGLFDDIKDAENAVVQARMKNALYERLGGILFLKADLRDTEVNYRIEFVENELALPPCRLPPEVVMGFRMSTDERKAKRKRWA